MMNKKAEYGGNAMFQNNKKAAFLDYLMIIVGTALMATAINSVFDYVRYGNRRLFRYCDPW